MAEKRSGYEEEAGLVTLPVDQVLAQDGVSN